MASNGTPVLTRIVRDGIAVWTDLALRERVGVCVAFTERRGGVSEPPFDSLDLAAHVGDDPADVDENRRRVLAALGLEQARERLALAEQVHGLRIASVEQPLVGSGAFAGASPGPVPETDALITSVVGVPLLLCFADCVPVILVAPGPVVAVVHAGWRGALGKIVGDAACALASQAAVDTASLLAYIGPHIGACHYEVGSDIMSQFCNTFGTVARARTGGLDLGAVVHKSLVDAGVTTWRITSLGVCTAEATESFFSYRAEHSITGRHGALACIVGR